MREIVDVPEIVGALRLPQGVTLTPTALATTRRLSVGEWLSLGELLGACEKAVQWWIGDFLNEFEHQHGEKYAQAVSPAQADTWKNYAWVCRSIEKSLRKDISYKHHEAVAPLAPPDQQTWLARAIEEKWGVHELRRNIKASKLAATPLPEGKYRVIYADPPWKYGDELIEGYGAAEHHYPTMSLEQLCELPICDLSADNAVLFLWTPAPLSDNGFIVAREWKFHYKAQFVWDKVRHNFGHYNSVRHELLLIATRGSCMPESGELHDSVVTLERSGEHSAKPPYFRELIDRMYPPQGVDRVELFARGELPPHWRGWGNEYGKNAA